MTFVEAMQILAAFDRHGVAYVLVGSMAMAAQGLVRATRDIDVFVDPGESNVARLKAALKDVFDDPAIDEISAVDLGGASAGSARRAGDQGAIRIGGQLMPVRNYRSVEHMPSAMWREPRDPRNLRIAFELSSVALRLAPRRFPPGVHRHHSAAAASEQREAWERATTAGGHSAKKNEGRS